METLSWIFHQWVFIVNLVFGAIVTLVVWVLIIPLFDSIKKKQKILAYLMFVIFMLASPFVATAVKNWATDAYHVAINVPQHYETQEEVDKRWAGFGYGVYYANWLFWGLAILFTGMSLVPGKEGETDAEDEAKEPEPSESDPPDSDS